VVALRGETEVRGINGTSAVIILKQM
jgi:hypothetical protein